jgi:dTDP-4-amino-4,6-dideoxygalactose transaminase
VITKVLKSAYCVLSDEVVGFESDLAAFCGANYWIEVNSGPSALHSCMVAANVGPGDEVIMVCFVATVRYVPASAQKVVYLSRRISQPIFNRDALGEFPHCRLHQWSVGPTTANKR